MDDTNEIDIEYANIEGDTSQQEESKLSWLHVDTDHRVGLYYMILSCIVGGFFDYYDYSLSTYFAVELSNTFFPSTSNTATTLMWSYLFTGTGYLARPIGGLMGGYTSDKSSRRMTLLYTIMGMGIPTLLIACIPSYSYIGYWSTVLALILRFIQGLSFGAEYTTSVVYIYEQNKYLLNHLTVYDVTPPNEELKNSKIDHLPFYMACSWAGTSGNILAVIARIILSNCMTEASLTLYGWRLAYFAGIFITAFGFYMRLQIPESRIFADSKGTKTLENPIFYFFRHIDKYWFSLLGGICIMMPLMLSWSCSISWMTTYLYDLHEPTMSWAYYNNLICIPIYCGVILLWGKIVSVYKISYYRSMIYMILTAAIAIFILYPLIGYTKNEFLILLYEILLNLLTPLVIPTSFCYLLEYVNDVAVRTTFLGLCYNIDILLCSFGFVEAFTEIVKGRVQVGMVYNAIFIFGIYMFCLLIISQLNKRSFYNHLETIEGENQPLIGDQKKFDFE